MYKPLFNTVLVEIDDKESQWGRGNDDAMGGQVFREGKLISVSPHIIASGDYQGVNGMELAEIASSLNKWVSKTVMWNEGHEAGTIFEEGGKKYALLYWWDLRGVKDEQ